MPVYVCQRPSSVTRTECLLMLAVMNGANYIVTDAAVRGVCTGREFLRLSGLDFVEGLEDQVGAGGHDPVALLLTGRTHLSRRA